MMKNRLIAERDIISAAKVLCAKTGTLSGVSALVGYTTTADGEIFALGIFISHYVGPATPARDMQDKIGNYLTGFSRHRVSNVNGKLSPDE
ncbi:MAG: D-alanyl-D-alanine carboxypeptidase [Candidatus Poribacteria bacterium]|nr:D-alanyl-D-alanine carboxypeptidase [Candidatus Poribacteria bacterium]